MTAGTRVLVMGFGVTGAAVARHLLGLGIEVVAVDDRAGPALRRSAGSLGVPLVEAPGIGQLAELATGAGLVVASPGVPFRHPVFSMGVPVVSELELAARAMHQQGTPLVAVTGTNGKTTVTTLVTEILVESGVRARSAGNIGVPLVEMLDSEAEVVVVEASSFQLAMTEQFRPRVATWLNLTPDHLDWHPSMDHYVASKARVWANAGSGDTSVANWDDPVVRSQAQLSGAETPRRFGLLAGAGYHEAGAWLRGPEGQPIIAVAELWRRAPHDRLNAMAACATALAAGGTIEACRAVLSSFGGLRHRLEPVGSADGVRWFDDSKATTPASVLAALAGFDSAVLIAGGRNKGLDLSALGTCSGRLRAVVAIGEAAGEVEAVFRAAEPPEAIPVLRAGSMSEAVSLAGATALPGDVVLLSPGCASFDWYRSYAERGEDFARLVGRHISKQVAS
ncbi:MAG: UDP-N-acetylmuramoyl-L-alanine--D-glutamate ligase [Acidimicrobiales bacterium]